MSTVRVQTNGQVILKDGVPCFYAQGLNTIKAIGVLRLEDPQIVVNGVSSSWAADSSIENNIAGSDREHCLKYGETKNFTPTFVALPIQQGVGYLVYLYDTRHETYQDDFWHVLSFCLRKTQTGLVLTNTVKNGCSTEPFINEDEMNLWQIIKRSFF